MRRVDEPRVASGSVGHWLLECRTQERSVRRVLSTVQNWTRSMGCDVMFDGNSSSQFYTYCMSSEVGAPRHELPGLQGGNLNTFSGCNHLCIGARMNCLTLLCFFFFPSLT